MIAKIQKALEKLNIAVWQITETSTENAELYYILKKEDIRREKNILEISVTVYRDFESDGKPMRGSSSVLVFAGMTEEEIENKLRLAYENAQYVKNAFFELADPVGDEMESEEGFGSLSCAEAASVMADALFTADEMEDAYINSAEIFASLKRTRILSSRGVNVSYSTKKISGEFVVECEEPEDVEMYHDFEYSDVDTLALSQLALDALSTVSDRAHASEAPKAGEYDLILTKKHVFTVLSAYAEKADAGMIFAKYSPYSVGMPVQGEEIKGEKLNITLVPDEPYSYDGVKMPERPLLKEGVLQSIHGATRFCRYLGIEPTGSYQNIRVENGSVPLTDMKKKPYLMPVAFSDFQMDALRGRFGGEIRLAYLFDGERIHLVTGGSVSGSLLEKQGELTFSTERYTDSNYNGPYAMLIPSVSVAGA